MDCRAADPAVCGLMSTFYQAEPVGARGVKKLQAAAIRCESRAEKGRANARTSFTVGSQRGKSGQNGANLNGEPRPRADKVDQVGVSRSDLRKRRPKTLLRIVIESEMALAYAIVAAVL